jgi:hypothetical protein
MQQGRLVAINAAAPPNIASALRRDISGHADSLLIVGALLSGRSSKQDVQPSSATQIDTKSILLSIKDVKRQWHASDNEYLTAWIRN